MDIGGEQEGAIDYMSQSNVLGEYRGILVDIDDPPTNVHEESNAEPPPSLINVFSLFLHGIFKSIINIFSLMFGFNIKNLDNVVLGKMFAQNQILF